MSLSDLELVQQAMAPTESGAQNTTNAAPNPPNGTSATAKDPLADLDADLAKLNDADRAALAPILNALKAAEGAEDGDADIEGILKQLDAADGAAGALESRLDRLLDSLGAMERDAEKECEEVEKIKAKTGEAQGK